MNIWFKYAITALMVVLVSEFAKRSDKLGGFIAALPLVTILTLVWLYLEHQSTEKIANHAYYTFWYVIPTLPMFLIFPYYIIINVIIIFPLGGSSCRPSPCVFTLSYLYLHSVSFSLSWGLQLSPLAMCLHLELLIYP